MPAVSDLSIVLFGSEGGYSAPLLRCLLARGLGVSAVVRLDHRPAEQAFPVRVEQRAAEDSLEMIARRAGISLISAPNLNDQRFIQQLTQVQADIFLVACFGTKLPARIWRDMPQRCWNLHPSLLPAYRGPSPLYWQIKHAEADTGLTLHEVNAQFDGGRIVAQHRCAFPVQQHKKSLDNWVSTQGAGLLYDALTLYVEGGLESEPQNEAQSSYFPCPQLDISTV